MSKPFLNPYSIICKLKKMNSIPYSIDVCETAEYLKKIGEFSPLNLLKAFKIASGCDFAFVRGEVAAYLDLTL